ncbi:hypothetical protein [Collimonas humicola]|uniref:hypothetical protein n=1 Tax=Collimonas humicola TaxID=2825886 RepID=UPI001B8D2BC4|nr:hypothetical protein [Collimonas humicola]
MKKVVLSMGLLLAAYCAPLMAAAPVFQLHGQRKEAENASAAYAYASQAEAAGSASAIAAMVAPVPAAAAGEDAFSAQGGRAWPAAGIVPVAFSSAPKPLLVPRKAAAGMNASDELLFYFLKDFRARPPQKPARWAVLFIALSFLLYQVRRRPMRTSIGFGSASRLAGQHAA